MKNCVLILIFLISSFTLKAQSIPVPTEKNKVVWVKQSKKLVELEKTELQVTYSSTRLTGKSSYALVAQGAKSSAIRSGNPSDVFIVKLDSGAVPEKCVELILFDEGKDQRLIPLGDKVLGKSHAAEMDKPILTFKKIADNVYTISVETQLELGEYCFIVNRPKIDITKAASGKAKPVVAYCFSVGS